MQRVRRRSFLGWVSLGLIPGLGVKAADAVSMTDNDPYLWLEDIHGAKALDWVKAQNVRSAALKQDPRYRADYDALLAMLDAQDRIPSPELIAGTVFNFWQDADHVHGIWRRTSLASYAQAAPQWETLLDVDALPAEAGKAWVFEGAQHARGLARCLISLSPGGGDAVVVREFDLRTKQFIGDGFSLPEAKSNVVYDGAENVLFGSDFGPGSLTDSGYPRIVKFWKRDSPIDSAVTVYEGTAKDVSVQPFALHGETATHVMIVRSVDFYKAEYRYVLPDATTLAVPLSEWADVKGFYAGCLIATLRQDWTPEGQPKIAEGSLIAFPLEEFLATRELPHIAVLFTPGERVAVQEIMSGRDAVYATIFTNVTGAVHAFRLQDGQWRDVKLALPEGGSPGVTAVDDFGSSAFFSYQSFLTPTTLYADAGDDKPQGIKALPARFDATPFVSEQFEAVSKDGTKIPYFVVHPKAPNGPQPMLLYGYGGFEISLNPWYWTGAGKVWLGQGGSYAVANIRGGGEFGPAWHSAAMQFYRQRAYDDFIAVAEDMVTRGLTEPKKLAIMGGSNGGLLVGATMVQRPDLFGAVVCQVPLLDMLRFTKLGAGPSWVAEYGDPDVPEQRAYLQTYSPYQNVKKGEKYPPVFFVTATSDDRVTPVHARKMAARMEEFGDDVLFYENTEGGHSAAADHAQQAEMNALTFLYLAEKLTLER